MSDSGDRLFWRVLLNAATKPLNVLVLAGMVVAAVLTTPWVLAAAVPIYGLLIAGTVRDPKEADRLAAGPQQAQLPGAKRSLQGITGPLRGDVIAVLNEERGIKAELERAPVRPDGVLEGVEAVCDELIVNARRASEVDLYLRSVDVAGLQGKLAGESRPGRPALSADAAASIQEQLHVIEALGRRRAAFDDEVANLQASLGTIRARLVQARAEAAPPTVGAADITELRDRMRALASGLAEAYGQNAESSPTTMKGT